MASRWPGGGVTNDKLAHHLEAECVQHRSEAELISSQHEYRIEPYLAGVQHAGDDIGGDHEIQVVAITDLGSSSLGLSDRSEGLRILVHFSNAPHVDSYL